MVEVDDCAAEVSVGCALLDATAGPVVVDDSGSAVVVVDDTDAMLGVAVSMIVTGAAGLAVSTMVWYTVCAAAAAVAAESLPSTSTTE